MSLKIEYVQKSTQITREEFKKVIKDLPLEIITSTFISDNFMDYILCKTFALQNKHKKFVL